MNKLINKICILKRALLLTQLLTQLQVCVLQLYQLWKYLYITYIIYMYHKTVLRLSTCYQSHVRDIKQSWGYWLAFGKQVFSVYEGSIENVE